MLKELARNAVRGLVRTDIGWRVAKASLIPLANFCARQRTSALRDESAKPRDHDLFPSKISEAELGYAVQVARKSFPHHSIVVLTDRLLTTEPYIECATNPVSVMDRYSPGETIFIYACEQDDIGAPFIQRAISMGAKFSPVTVATPSSYANINSIARRVLEEEFVFQTKNKFAKWDFGAGDFVDLLQVIEATADIAGAYLEIGCYQGSSAGVALRYMAERRLHRSCFFLGCFRRLQLRRSSLQYGYTLGRYTQNPRPCLGQRAT